MRNDPEQASMYVELVFDKIRTLIKYGVWDNVTEERFNNWKRQFSEEDTYFAAYLAFQLLYYNKKDFLALISWAFAETVRRVAISLVENINDMDEALWEAKILEAKAKVLVCPFAVDSPAASGNMVVRLLRNQNLADEFNMCSVDEIRDKLRTNRYSAIVFVDDMIGSGDQARQFCLNSRSIRRKGRRLRKVEYIRIKRVLDEFDIQKFLAVGIAPVTSVRTVQRQTGLEVVAAELLADCNSTLNNRFWFQQDFDDGIEFLKKMELDNRIPRIGHSDSSWAVAFEHGAPDVSSPFYYQEHIGWTALVPVRGVDI